MKRVIYILLLAGLFFPVFSVAQQVTIRGVVKDAIDNGPLPLVSARLLTARDSSFVTGTTGDNDGVFVFKPVKAGSYIAVISYLGYKTE